MTMPASKSGNLQMQGLVDHESQRPSSSDRAQRTGARRSRTGCLYCRRRKIKCDEQRPSCGACSRSGRRCDNTTAIFRQHECSFTTSAPIESPWKSPPIRSSTTGSTTDDNVWVQIPSQVVFVNEDDQEHDPTRQRQTSIEALNEPSSFAATSPDSMIASSINLSQDMQQTVLRPHGALPEHGMPVDSIEPPTISLLHRPDLQHRQSTSSQMSHDSPDRQTDFPVDRSAADENREDSFFLRHFSETPGRWMDLFDLDCYYSLQVPVLARRNPLVRYAACAFAAKQLGRVHGQKSVRGGVSSRLSSMETWPDHRTIDYAWFGMRYYDKSISLLMEHISQASHEHRDEYNRRYNDETIVAATILCNYEFLSATTAEWSRHLDGTQSLLRLTNEVRLFQFQPSPRPSSSIPEPPKALRAAFWNFARQDFLASCELIQKTQHLRRLIVLVISRKHTRLNTDDLDMWHAMGLLFDDNGLIAPSNLVESSEPVMRDDMISNALIWLMSKITNFIAAKSRNSSSRDVSDTAADGELQVKTWKTLDFETSVWKEGLPDTFHPSARIQLTDQASSQLQWETWYSNSMCASTMQSYHMARMLLLIHQPAKLLLESFSTHTPTGAKQGQDLLSAYRSMQAELRTHAVEICSIALGRPDDSTRIHMLQPLYVAGRAMTDSKDQETIINLMRSLEGDLGWAAEYRVDHLLQEWGTGENF